MTDKGLSPEDKEKVAHQAEVDKATKEYLAALAGRLESEIPVLDQYWAAKAKFQHKMYELGEGNG